MKLVVKKWNWQMIVFWYLNTVGLKKFHKLLENWESFFVSRGLISLLKDLCFSCSC